MPVSVIIGDNVNIAERGAYWARWQPAAEAVSIDGEQTTWADLQGEVARIAGGLRERGIGVGDRVGILAANSLEWCEIALATLHLGGIVVPLNVRLAGPELGLILEHSGCAAVAYDSSLEGLLDATPSHAREGVLKIALDPAARGDVAISQLATGKPIAVADRSADDAAVIGYTSGTTGLPKGVVLTHGNVAAAGLQTAVAERSTAERRTLLCVPLPFTGGVINNFLSTYVVGGTLVLESAFEPGRVLRLLSGERITTLFAVPVMWQAIADADGFAGADLSALTSAITGGAAVPEALLAAYLAKGVRIRQAYGLTEATGSCCLLPVELAETKATTAGVPNVHTRVRLVDEDGNEVAVGEVGEITIRGPQVMGGYWQDADATADSIRDGWLFTGDLGRFDDDGLLSIVDRKKSMFISGGLNVYPAEVERVVDQLEDVAECAAFGLVHERWGEACAVVVRGQDGPVDEARLVEHCRAQLSDYKVPKTIFQAEQPLPRGMSGKIARNEIQKMYG